MKHCFVTHSRIQTFEGQTTNEMKRKKIIIIGAGIGGLTTALSLHAKGFEVDIYESAKEIKPLGVGINLLPHAVRVLTNLGLIKELSGIAVATSELVYHNKFGQKIWQEPRGKFAGYNWSQFSVHRGTFQMVLLETVKKKLGEQWIHTGHYLQYCENREGSVEATFADKETNEVIAKEEAHILIGADGIHSVVRKQFYPGEGLPKFSGIILHRGTTRAKPFLTGSSMIMAGSADKKFVAYPITPEPDETGHQLINWIADLRVSSKENIMPQDWNRRADKANLVREFDSWHFNWLDVPSLIHNAEAIYEFPMSDRDPLPHWSFGRITLLGDAAHPMYPIGSNGASQAILDAECLSECLLDNDDIISALKNYEIIRLPATAKIVLQNRQMGPEQVMQIVEDRAPDGFKNLYDVISKEELESIAARYKQIAGFDKDALNQKQ
jgi:2-polyprenyl-6-methoxyphenol hydroxylase-like FAD-dependent oxidoreductase